MNNNEKRRLRAIKFRLVLVPTKCDSCGDTFVRQKMWTFTRYGMSASHFKWYYCQNCMHSKEDVLNEIDTDEYPFGLYRIDNFDDFEKKDDTRMNAAIASHQL